MTELEAPRYRWIGEMRDGATGGPASRRFAEAAEAIAAVLIGNQWLLDDQFTVADIICVGVLGSAASRDPLDPWPVLRDYVERGQGRPAHAEAVAHAV